VDENPRPTLLKFGPFELDLKAEQLLRNGRVVRLQPQPFKLLCLLVGQPGRVVSREEIQSALWSSDTFVDFEQGVNFAIKQVREALGDHAERAVFIQTVHKRGYRFLAPVNSVGADASQAPAVPGVHFELEKVLWENIAELRLAEASRLKRQKVLVIVLAVAAVVMAVIYAIKQ
jgi:DNA-binding winged helix-turn-helix (wHTH) protein